jgi:transcriptional regulator with PAS, ATPase and Fis domain
MMQGDLSEVLPMIKQIEEGQYDVIISRGGTARLLRRHVSIPVIDIQVSGYDMMRIITLVKGNQAKVEMIGFPNVIEGFISVSRIMNIEIPYTAIEHENEVGTALAKAKASGVNMVLGDTVTVRKAQEYGLEGVLITSGKESVLEAFAQARYMQVIADRYQQKCLLYEHMLDKLDTGYAVFDEYTRLQYGNNSFCKQWGLSREKLTGGELSEQSPQVAGILNCLRKGIIFDKVVTGGEVSQSYVISAGPFKSEAGHGLYVLQTDSRALAESELRINFSLEDLHSYPLLPLEQAVTGNTAEADKGDISFPLALYGEKGSGKRLWCLNWSGADQQGRFFMEVELLKSTNRSLEGLQSLLFRLDSGTVLYVRGIENADQVKQRSIAAWIEKAQAQVILSFDQAPDVLLEKAVLEPGMYELIKEKVLYFPPLSERKEELEALIRSFIAKANESTGKQVVGMRPPVLDALLNHPWTGNFIELKETVERFVQNANGEFIDESALEMLGQREFGQAGGSGAQKENRGINLNQTLEEIERDIILAVLNEEQMNQSKAAKRLGINRSTLWRKLKQNESESGV